MRFDKSNAWLERTRKTIPNCSQTYSKSPMYYPIGASPLAIDHGKGAHVWDLDGNEYIDFVCGLGPITLGYQYKAVDNAIKKQLNKGIIFSLPSELEVEMAELIHSIVPFAEMSRFMKSGSEACAASIRVARAFTDRDMVLTSGYHGWSSEFAILTDRIYGIPDEYDMSIRKFQYNDIDELQALFDLHPDQVACVIMEPCVIESPRPGYLETIKLLCEQNGALLIFDEVVTCPRFPTFTASQYFRVIPDLMVTGKGLANGGSLGMVSGRADIMEWFNKIMVSGTYHGNCLDLAAGISTIQEILEKDTPEYCWKLGTYLQEELVRRGIRTRGFPCRPMICLPDESPEAKTLYLEQLIQKGILVVNSMVLNLCFSHTTKDIDQLIDACSEADIALHLAIISGDIKGHCQGQIVQSAFKRLS